MRKAILISSVLFTVGIIGVANAQQALPRGGDDFETAVEIKPGSYKGRSLKSHETEYFYVADVKPGQELKIKGTFTPETDLSAIATIDLYDEDRTDLKVGCYESGEGTMDISCDVSSWLTNSDKETYKYYIRTGSDTWNITSYLLDVSLLDRFDAGSQTDAGDTVEKAIKVESGEYKGYLSGKRGIDTKDFYKVAVKKGETLTTKVTPPSDALMTVAVYDSNRAVLKSEDARNAGAIVTNSLKIAKSGDVFVAVVCDKYCTESEKLVAYNMDITMEEAAVDEAEAEAAVIGVEEDVTKYQGEEKGLSLGLIAGVIAGVIILAAVIYLLLKKKKQ